MLTDLNLVAILVVTIVGYMFAFFWYGPLFGKQWIELAEFPAEKQKENQKRNMAPVMIVGFISQLAMTTVMAYLITALNITTFVGGMILGAIIWLGFIGTITLGSVLWEMKSVKLWLLNNAYNLILMGAMGAALALWR